MICLLMALIVHTTTIQCKTCHNEIFPVEYKLSERYIEHIITDSAKKEKINLTTNHKTKLKRIAYRESSYNVSSRSQSSTAYGLWGFLNSTWKNVGFRKTNCPYCQTRAALRYIKRRYKSIDKAWNHHLKHHWY